MTSWSETPGNISLYEVRLQPNVMGCRGLPLLVRGALERVHWQYAVFQTEPRPASKCLFMDT
jgi:hypothetical protein